MKTNFKTAINCYSLVEPQAATEDIKILPLSGLDSYHDDILEAMNRQGKVLRCVTDVLGVEVLFFYELYQFRAISGSQNVPLFSEYGVAKLAGRKTAKRVASFERFTYEGGAQRPVSGGDDGFFDFSNTKDADYCILVPTIPKSYTDCLCLDNSVLCSIESHLPSPVELQEGTLLGRLDDRIQSIDAQELRQILNGDDDTYLKLTDKELEHVFKGIKKIIFDTLKENKTAIVTKSQKIDLLTQHSSVAAPVLQVKPEYTDKNRPPKPRAGMIIFNKDKKAFEGYDGKFWKRLAWD